MLKKEEYGPCINSTFSESHSKMNPKNNEPNFQDQVSLKDLFSLYGKNPFFYTLKENARINGFRECYSWIGSNGDIKKKFTYRELFEKVVELSWYLSKKLGIKAGDKVILCYTPGYDFVIAFTTCLVSGIVAVPVYPPDPMRGQSEIQRFCDIKQASETNISLTCTSYMRSIEIAKTMSTDKRFKSIRFEATDNLKIRKEEYINEVQKAINDIILNDSNYCDFLGFDFNINTVAFLQFTSGSTSQPKGVMVTHGNLLYNIHICISSYSFPSVLEEHYKNELDSIPAGITVLKKNELTEDELSFINNEFGEEKNIMSLNDIKYDKSYLYMSIINKVLYKNTMSSASVFSWLPVYHDMGLIGFFCTPLFFGCNIFQMSPIDFIKKPYLWMQCMDKYNCSVSGAPNFAFEVVVRKTPKEILNQLNLKHVFAILSGAEPIRKTTIDRFTEAFKSVGIKHNVIKPAYGLAEHTLIVAGNNSFQQEVNHITVNTKKLREKNIVEIKEATEKSSTETTSFVSSGIVYKGIDLRIVNPESLKEVTPGNVGEIWISSESVTLGYYNNKEETEKTFNANFTMLDGKTSKSTYMRTGDSGFIINDMLYISGRIKDMIIIRGRNFYPQDIEEVIDGVSGVRQGSVAVFSVTQADGEEAIGVAVEIRMETSILGRVRRFFEKPAYDNIVRAISKAVFIGHGLPVHYIWLLSPRTILKTSSGKIRRSQTRDAIFSKKLVPLFEWVCEQSPMSDILVERSSQFISPTSMIISKSGVQNKSKFYEKTQSGQQKISEQANDEKNEFDIDQVKIKIIEFAAQVLGITQKDLDLNAPLHEYGIDSLGSIRLSEMMNEEFGVELDSTLLFNYPTVIEIVDFVAAQISGKELHKKNLLNRSGIDSYSDIVVVGMSCSFPGGSSTPGEFWSLLQSGVDAIGEIPKSRWNIDEYYSTDLDLENKMYTKEGGFIENIDHFGASFFKISHVEARSMDPQQRIFLEKSFEALKDVGYTIDTLKKRNISVFAGCCSNDWTHVCKSEANSNIGTYAATSHAASIIANRVSYTLGLTGSSVTVDSACSASIVALHVSLQEISTGQCEAAVVGGINLMLSPQITVALCKARMLSMDCRCKSFDAAANGYVRGEGVGVLVLKTMKNANNGEKIYSVIKGSSVNHNGRSASLTAPNGISQQNVINSALEYAGIRPNDISYIEAHGTGTSLGDPIEVSALKSIFSRTRDSGKPLIIGAVKTNIGHLEGAAGMAGIFKVILSLINDTVPPNLHFKNINPHINLKGFPVIIPTSNIALQTYDGSKTCAGVSAFGFGGTNAHAIFEKPSLSIDLPIKTGKIETNKARNNPVLFVFGFQGFQHVNMGKYYFEREIVYREWFLKCCKIIDPFLKISLKSLVYPETKNIEKLRELNKILEQEEYAQCALFAVQYSLAKLLESKGIYPGAVIGLSDGELVASVYCGSINLEDGLKLCMLRASLLSEFSAGEGKMALFNVSKEDAEMALADVGPQYNNRVSIFASISSNQVLLSGDEEKLETVVFILKEYYPRANAHSIDAKFLRTKYSFGTNGMNGLIEPISNLMENIALETPMIPMISGTSGYFVYEELTSPKYWGWQLNNKLSISKALNTAILKGASTILDLMPISRSEFGISEIFNFENIDKDTIYYSLFEDTNLESYEPNKFNKMIEMLSEILLKNSYNNVEDGCVQIMDSNGSTYSRESFPWNSFKHSILGEQKSIDRSVKIVSTLNNKSIKLFSDHKVYETIVIPGAGLIDLAAASIITVSMDDESILQGSNALFGESIAVKLNNVLFEKPVVVNRTSLFSSECTEVINQLKSYNNLANDQKTNLICNIESDGNISIQYCNINNQEDFDYETDNSMIDCFSCKAKISEGEFVLSEDLAQLKNTTNIKEDPKIMYEEYEEIGLKYGKKFRVVKEIYRNETCSIALGKIYLPETCKFGTFESGFYFHPAILDGALHVAGSLLKYKDCFKSKQAMVPVSIEEIEIKYVNANQMIWAAAYLSEATQNYSIFNLVLFDSEGSCIGKLEKVSLRQFNSKNISKPTVSHNEILWITEWEKSDVLKFSKNISKESDFDLKIALIHSGICNISEKDDIQLPKANISFVNLDTIKESNIEELERLIDITSLDSLVFLSPVELALSAKIDCEKISIDILEYVMKICKLYLKILKQAKPAKQEQKRNIPNFWIVTTNSQNLINYDVNENIYIPNNSGLWGLAKSANLEISSLLTNFSQPIKSVDLEITNFSDNQYLRKTIGSLVRWIGNFEYSSLKEKENLIFKFEREFSITSKNIYVNRINKFHKQIVGPVELFMQNRGSISNLSLIESEPIQLEKLNDYEVVMRVKSIGLNFRDVLNVMGLYPGDPGPPGGDCSGTVVAVCEGVKHIKVGDNVFGIAPGCLKTYVTTDSNLLCKIPKGFTFEQAAALPVVATTVEYSLRDIANIKKGDIVLVHAVTGGVGLMVVQYCKAIGAKVYGTAGSESKVEYALSNGVERVSSSRNA
ncbi:Beta-ketoacyl synthase N-terminal domain protein, partial [Cryptosporidium hominis]